MHARHIPGRSLRNRKESDILNSQSERNGRTDPARQSCRKTATPVLVNLAKRSPSPAVSAAVAVGIMLVMGILDYLTGLELSFSIFYLLPVSIAAISSSILGLVVAFLSACTWLIADLLGGHEYSHPLIVVWNATVRLGYFCLHAFFISALRMSLEHERELARLDPLTGAANWRGLEEYALREFGGPSPPAHPVTVACVDIDNFKEINDRFGHQRGNDILRAITLAAARNIRGSDIVARIGGDEFCIILPGAEPSGAQGALERMRRQLTALAAEQGWPITLSVGAVTFYPPLPPLSQMLDQADALMYTVKRSGKNDLKYEIKEGSSPTA